MAEVKSVRLKLAKLSFPVPEHTVEQLLPRPLTAITIGTLDGFALTEKKVRIGGIMVEYWLNRKYVLRVATAYYSEGDSHYSMEEWAVVLSRSQRQNYNRPIY